MFFHSLQWVLTHQVKVVPFQLPTVKQLPPAETGDESGVAARDHGYDCDRFDSKDDEGPGGLTEPLFLVVAGEKKEGIVLKYNNCLKSEA
ncbi:hypothetical protein TNCV_559211 [Trichonephila clavipes]|nr:hypothetical protein TNCV_559211 [Trichonephila clavipes]